MDQAFRKRLKAKARRPQAASALALVAMALFAGVLAGPACQEKNAYAPPPPPPVTISQPERQDVTDFLDFTGNTQSINTVQLRARVEGYLEKVLFKDGERVKKGQLLFVIQQNTYVAKLQQAQAEILSQKANNFHARTEFTRYSKLASQHAASQTDVDQWRYQREASRANILAAEASRDLAKLNLGYTKVTAPFDGRIDRHLVDPGNLVGAGEQTVLAEINQVDPIYTYFTINEQDLLRLLQENRLSLATSAKSRLPVYIGLADETGYPHRGRLDFAAISVTSTTGTLLLRGIFPNADGRILPGLFARVRVPVAVLHGALVVPQVAIGYDQQGNYVLVVSADNVVERRSVTLGPKVDDQQVIAVGLEGQEWVIVNGVLQAIPGRKVNPTRKPAAPPAAGPTPAPAQPGAR